MGYNYSKTKLVCEKFLMYCHNRMDFPQEIGTQHDKCFFAFYF